MTLNHIHNIEHMLDRAIGFDRMFDRLHRVGQSAPSQGYPPYNILKLDDVSQELQIALAGFKREDIEVAVERGVLSVSAKHENNGVGEFVHRGIARRSVARNWQLGENTVVDEPKFIDGMLYITVRQEVPEEQRRKVLPIS